MQDELVNKYLNLDNQIKRLEQKKEENRIMMYQENLFAHSAYEDDRIRTKNSDAEKRILDLITADELIDNRIKRMKIRQRAFDSKLTLMEYNVMSEHKKDEVRKAILQAEIYTAYHCGFEPPNDELELTQDINTDIGLLADYFEEVSY